jgi:hypothetical protein
MGGVGGTMKGLITPIATAALLVSWFPQAAHAAFILGNAVFDVQYSGSGEEGDSYDPPLLGHGTFVVRSLHYNPNAVDEDPFPPSEFNVLDFSFTFNGQSWDESDVPICVCSFTPEGLPLDISFDFADGVVSWILSWSFGDNNFGFRFHDATLDLRGTTEDRSAFSRLDHDFRVLPEPGSFALLALGLALVAVIRRRRVT